MQVVIRISGHTSLAIMTRKSKIKDISEIDGKKILRVDLMRSVTVHSHNANPIIEKHKSRLVGDMIDLYGEYSLNYDPAKEPTSLFVKEDDIKVSTSPIATRRVKIYLVSYRTNIKSSDRRLKVIYSNKTIPTEKITDTPNRTSIAYLASEIRNLSNKKIDLLNPSLKDMCATCLTDGYIYSNTNVFWKYSDDLQTVEPFTITWKQE